MVTRYLSCCKVLWVLHHYHLLLWRETPADVPWENREKRNDKNHHEKASFFSTSWVLKWFFCFVFGENILKSIRQEVFYKKDVLWNFAKFRVNDRARVLEAAWNFIKKEALAQVFSSEFWEISKNTFSYRTPPVAASPSSLPKYLLAISVKYSLNAALPS